MRVGDVVGRYCVTGVLGRGGMAVVHSGHHVILGLRVAIKVLHRNHLANPIMERRFLNEARALSALQHPGIVALLDAGRTPEGRGYLVMELLDGENLAARLQRGPVPLEAAIAFGRQLTSALATAHAHGIVHRDLKPANILLCADPSAALGERAKLLDFGIAKRIAGDTPAPITESGIIIGTPEYMSPEQCRGDELVDARSDIYCLGLVLYHMVTGRYPFEQSDETDEIFAQQLHAQSAPPSRLDPGVPAALSRVIARCMAKSPDDRYQRADEVDADLADIETLIAVHEDLGATDEILDATEVAPRLTREIDARPTWFRRMRLSRRELWLAGIALGAAAVSATSLRSPPRAGATLRLRVDPPVADVRAPMAPARALEQPSPPPPVATPSQRAKPVRAAAVRHARPRRHPSPPPRESSYEDIETPVVY